MLSNDKEDLILRPFADSDSQQLARLCNNKKIWDNVRDFIPFPYTEQHAEEFINFCKNENPKVTFAIERKGELTGCIGLVRQSDVYRLGAELGYWIGEPFWNQGIATEAVRLITQYGFEKLRLLRICSGVFDFNTGSKKVLEKAGFKMEGVFEQSIVKNGVICNEYRYAKINPHFVYGI